MILAKVRLDGKIAIAITSFGIVALLLDSERTIYSRFKILLKLTKFSLLNINQ